MSLIKIILVRVGHKWWLDDFIQQPFPIKIFQPRMMLDLIGPIVPQPLRLLPLYQPVTKISSLEAPGSRDLFFLYTNLSGLNLVADLFSGAPDVRPAAHHVFVYYNPNCIIVRGIAMVLSAHDLRGFWVKTKMYPYNLGSHWCPGNFPA